MFYLFAQMWWNQRYSVFSWFTIRLYTRYDEETEGNVFFKKRKGTWHRAWGWGNWSTHHFISSHFTPVYTDDTTTDINRLEKEGERERIKRVWKTQRTRQWRTSSRDSLSGQRYKNTTVHPKEPPHRRYTAWTEHLHLTEKGKREKKKKSKDNKEKMTEKKM